MKPHLSLGDPSIATAVADVIDRMSPDPLLAEYCQKLRRAGAGATPYWDLACALHALAGDTPPRAYLEIGVRRGKSMAQVAARAPRCALLGVDLWVQPYAGADNPGPDYVREQLQGLGFEGELTFLSGDSRVVLPAYFEDHPALTFDMVTVDGDHSDEGAWADLCNVAPRVAPGGYLFFDDLIHPAHTLAPVWDRFQQVHAAEFEFVTNLDDHNGTGVGRRRS